MRIIKAQDGGLVFVQHFLSIHEMLWHGKEFYIAASLTVTECQDECMFLGHYPNHSERKRIMNEIERFLLDDNAKLYAMPPAAMR
jgi:hypothetical protein